MNRFNKGEEKFIDKQIKHIIMTRISKLKIVLFTFMILSLLNTNSSSLAFIEEVEIYGSISSEYYSTSPVEYFNETKHPRYSVVARPIDLIISPNKGRPVIAEFSENITVEINSTSHLDDCALYLVNDKNTIELDILEQYNNEESTLLIVHPISNTEGLYDLQFNSTIGNDYQTHSVKIVEEKEYPFKFLHISDSHIPCYGELNTTDICLKYIAEIKNLDVDFAIFTGDLIEGGPAWLFVDPVTEKPLAAEIQLKLGLWALDLLDMPVYIIGGNHDLDYSTIIPDIPREIWEKYLGKNNVISFKFLNWLYVGYTVTESGLTSSEYNIVKGILSPAHQDNIPSILFYHSDYMNQATNLRRLYSIEVMLYGHEHHEELSVKSNTLYYCVDTMFNNASSVFTVLNGTSIKLKEKVYDFSMLLQETITKTSFSSLLVLFLTPIFVSCLILKRRETKLTSI